ncbi:hypothetical protein AG1IA_06733 [Rhizoctonia solani AG-1 IA]|uniref:Uncharacterized protein n=1 Tax=Thanatephorus cucumeris (strain AG1-IA) TaxID=983506 RepID=L8WR66_THACA|nr:hypothetical protein AG1IA_06733 [Rhizoctonia solani AG-1 IA]
MVKRVKSPIYNDGYPGPMIYQTWELFPYRAVNCSIWVARIP